MWNSSLWEQENQEKIKKNNMTNEQTDLFLDQLMEKPKKQKTKQQPIRLDKLHPLENHPYKIVDDEAMKELKLSFRTPLKSIFFLSDISTKRNVWKGRSQKKIKSKPSEAGLI